MIETRVAFISLIDDDILCIRFKPHCTVDIDDFEENMQTYRKLLKTEKAYLLSIPDESSAMSLEVRNKFASKERSSFKIAEAFVITSLGHKLIANFVMKVQTPKHKIRFFSKEEEAMNWLKQVKNEMKKQNVQA